ncbi:hypothetical protein SAV31267_056730 [Streptomyces avermitilis]|uniref:Uncharacterized protein n=1 Tax=Streptomyces avermitilis TaxID=33903 RepID=A0A4D4MVJ6_STRAX|nr:hypothetical protein SAV31267_056730 [Streptomyces avermitilis]
MFLMGGPVVALSWNVRMMLRHNPEGAVNGSSDGGLLEKVGLARAQIGAAKVEPNRVTAPLAVVAGEQTNDDVTKALARIASALDLPTSAVRYTPDAGSSRRGELVIVPEDMLADVVEWEGPSNLGVRSPNRWSSAATTTAPHSSCGCRATPTRNATPPTSWSPAAPDPARATPP